MREIVPLHIRLREFWWAYPTYLKSAFTFLGTVAIKFRPYSWLVIVGFVCAGIGAFLVWQYPSIEGVLAESKNNYLIEAVVSPPVKVDPLPMSSTPGAETQFVRDLNSLIFDPLMRIDKDGNVRPYLASNVTMQDDARTISVNLRKDVLWQDGESVTIEDVKFTMDLIRSAGSSGIYFGSVDGVTVNTVDEYTLSIVLERSNPAYLETLLWPVLPKHILEGVSVSKITSHAFAASPIGTGPFKLESLRTNQVMLKTNYNYWGTQPKVDGVIFYLFETAESAMKALSAGQVHSFCYYDMANKYLEADDRVAARYSAPLPKRTVVLYFNLRREDIPVGNENVRKALSLATPKAQIIEDVFGSYADISYGPIAEWSWAFNSEIDYYNYDLNLASQILDEAGYKYLEGSNYRSSGGTQLAVALTFQQDPIRQEIVEKIKTSWESVGVRVDLVEVPYKMGIGIDRIENALYETILPVRDFEVLLFTKETSLDPDLYNQYYSTKSDYPGANISGYSEVRTDVNLEQGRATTEIASRKEVYDAIQRRLMNTVPEVYMFTPHMTYFVSGRVTGINLGGLVFPEDRFLSIADWEV